MRYAIFVFSLIFLGCQKNALEGQRGTRLQVVKTAGKITERFSYNAANQLIQEAMFTGCETNPTDEAFYTYNGTKLQTIKTVTRSLYSSTAALCDPASGIHASAEAGYDNGGRLTEVVQSNGSTLLFTYNAQNFITAQTIRRPGNADVVTQYKRDARGNITEVTDASGTKTTYAFDNNPNPYYLIKRAPALITPFYNSPNNVVKIITPTNTVRIQYTYNSQGLPATMTDPNGSTYEFVYQ